MIILSSAEQTIHQQFQIRQEFIIIHFMLERLSYGCEWIVSEKTASFVQSSVNSPVKKISQNRLICSTVYDQYILLIKWTVLFFNQLWH